MVFIKKISTISSNSETSALFTLILKAFAKNDWSTDTYLTPLIDKLNTTNTSLIEAVNRLKIYSQLAEKDDVRDRSLRSLFKLVEGYTHMPVEKLEEAALTVQTVLNQYGLKIQNEDYATESADIESLLNDLSKPDILIAVAKLQGVDESIAILTADQQDFENVALMQAETEILNKDVASASTLKVEGITDFNTNIVDYMNTMAKVNPLIYEATTKVIGELIDKNNEMVKRRQKTDRIVR